MRSLVAAALAAVLAHGADAADEIVVAFGAEPQQVDPTRSSAGVDGYYMDLFYENLLAVTPDFDRVNWLAEHWEVVDDEAGLRIAVKIREGVKFHNGDELTSHDFAYAYERQSDPTSRTAGRLRHVDGVRIHDDYRFDMILGNPDGSLEPLNLILAAIPRKYFQEVGDDGVQVHPIGTGPWKFVSRKVREELVVERFEDYWNRDAMPVAKRLRIKIIPEDTTRVAAFKTGAVDWIDAVPPAQVEEFEATSGVRVASLPAPNNLYVALNAIDAGSPFRFPKVRQAAAHAVNVDDIVQYVLYGQGIRTAQLAPGTLGYDPGLKPYPYDPARARVLLAEAGYPAGVNVNCYNLTTPREPYFKGNRGDDLCLPDRSGYPLPDRAVGVRRVDQPRPPRRASAHGRHHEHHVGTRLARRPDRRLVGPCAHHGRRLGLVLLRVDAATGHDDRDPADHHGSRNAHPVDRRDRAREA